MFGDREAEQGLGREQLDKKAFQANARRLEQRLARLGVLKRLSDACGYVQNPFERSSVCTSRTSTVGCSSSTSRTSLQRADRRRARRARPVTSSTASPPSRPRPSPARSWGTLVWPRKWR